MRLLHTSDWHIGRTFHGQDLLAEQEKVLATIAEVVVQKRIDVVAVAGDVYDRAVPSAEAVGVCNRAFAAIQAAGATLVVTAGNHDSATRLGAFGQFTASGGLHLRTAVRDLARPIELTDEHGSMFVYGIPYLEPEIARVEFGMPEVRGHQEALTVALDKIRADLPAGVRSVVLAHAFVIGGTASDSERNISVGGVEHVTSDVFDGIDYVALGHLHGPQTIAEHIRYSGSPLAYSFSEEKHRKSVWIVDFDAVGVCSVERLELPVPRPLARISGLLEELLTDRVFDSYLEHFLSVTVTDQERPVDGMRKLRERFPYAVHMDWQPPFDVTSVEIQAVAVKAGKPDAQICAEFVEECRGTQATEAERALVAQAIERLGKVEA
jgi:exonuclease SbcD